MFWYLSQLFMQLFIFDKEEGKNDHWRNSDHEKKTTFILDLVNLCQIKLYSVIPFLIKEILINNSSKWWSFNTFICVCINERYTCLQDTALNHLFYSVWILTASGLLLDYSIPIMLMLINVTFFKEIFDTFSPLKSFPPLPLFSYLSDDLPSATETYSSWEKSFYSPFCFVVQSLSLVLCFAIPGTVARHVPLSRGFPRPEYWNGVPFPSPGYLPDPGIQPKSPALAGGFFTAEPPGKPIFIYL